MRALLTLVLVFGSAIGRAQDYGLSSESSPSSFSFKLDLQYTNLTYKEPGVMTESGQFAGFRGEFRWNPTPSIGLSLGGYYMDGNLNYDGATFSGIPVEVITNDYFREYRALVHFNFIQSELAIGYANRQWFNDLMISYSRTTDYSYFPIRGTYNFMPFYVSAEYRFWGGGKNKSTMSVVDPARSDVNFTQDSGTGFALEVGFEYPFGPFEGQVHLIYDYWSVDDSSIAFDGVDTLIEPENNTTSIILGMGIKY